MSASGGALFEAARQVHVPRVNRGIGPGVTPQPRAAPRVEHRAGLARSTVAGAAMCYADSPPGCEADGVLFSLARMRKLSLTGGKR